MNAHVLGRVSQGSTAAGGGDHVLHAVLGEVARGHMSRKGAAQAERPRLNLSKARETHSSEAL